MTDSALLTILDTHLNGNARAHIVSRLRPHHSGAINTIRTHPERAPRHPAGAVIEVIRQTSDPQLVAAIVAADQRASVQTAAAQHHPDITATQPDDTADTPRQIRDLAADLDDTCDKIRQGTIQLDSVAALLRYIDVEHHQRIIDSLGAGHYTNGVSQKRQRHLAELIVTAIEGHTPIRPSAIRAQLDLNRLACDQAGAGIAEIWEPPITTELIAGLAELDAIAAFLRAHAARHQHTTFTINADAAETARKYAARSATTREEQAAAVVLAVLGRQLDPADIDLSVVIGEWEQLIRLAPLDMLVDLIDAAPQTRGPRRYRFSHTVTCTAVMQRRHDLAGLDRDDLHTVASYVADGNISNTWTLLSNTHLFPSYQQQLDFLTHITAELTPAERCHTIGRLIVHAYAVADDTLGLNLLWDIAGGVNVITTYQLPARVASQLTGRLHDQLGDQADHWDTFLELADNWGGSIAELVDTAAAL